MYYELVPSLDYWLLTVNLPFNCLRVLSDEYTPTIFREPKDTGTRIKEDARAVGISLHLHSYQEDV